MTPRLKQCLSMTAAFMTLACSGCFRVAAKTDDPAVETVPVLVSRARVEDVPLDVAAVGNVEPINSVEVKSRVGGPISQVGFLDGQNVTAGQLLFTVDGSSLERQTAEEAALVERDRALEKQARSVAARDAATAQQSTSDADIADKLGQLGVVSGQRVHQLATAGDTANAQLASDRESLTAAQSTTRADKARLASTQLQMSFTRVAAPISGRAGAALVRRGGIVRENDTTLVSIMQLAPIYVSFVIPEESFPQVRELMAHSQLDVTAISENGVQEEGHAAFADNTVDPATGAIRLRAVFANTDDALWPGEFVHVRLRLRMDRARTVIPDAAVQQGLHGSYVWRIHSGRAAMAPVTVVRLYTPPQGANLAVLSSGIESGDQVVTEGQLRLTAGVRVSLADSVTGTFSQ